MNPQEFIQKSISNLVVSMGYSESIAVSVSDKCVDNYRKGTFCGSSVMQDMLDMAKDSAQELTGMTPTDIVAYNNLCAYGKVSKDDVDKAQLRAIRRLVKIDKAAYDSEDKSWRAC